MVRSFVLVMGRWPSFSRSGSKTLLRIHQCLKGGANSRSQHVLPVPVWEGIEGRLTLLNHPHFEAFVGTTYVRPSEFLALIKKDHVQPLVLLLP